MWLAKKICLLVHCWADTVQCMIFFLSYDIKLGLARSNLALRDRIWPCEIKFGLARSNLALQDRIWLCEINNGLARSNMALRDQIRHCEMEFVLARFFVHTTRDNLRNPTKMLHCVSIHSIDQSFRARKAIIGWWACYLANFS